MGVKEAVGIDLGELYQPHAVQRLAHAAQAKTKVLEWARRTGKSRAALWEMVRRYTESLSRPVPIAKVPPFHAWVVSPTFPQARQAWNEMLAFLPPAFIAPGGIHHHDMYMYLRGNENREWALLEVKSAHDPEVLQTAGLDFLWITEAQDIVNRAFEKVLPAIRSPQAMGYAVIEGIPALYPEHWWWRLCELAAATPDYYYQHATYKDNPMLTPEQVAEIEQVDRQLLPDAAWRRMYLAERSTEAGFFKGVDGCIAGDFLPGPVPGTEYVAGLDLGRLTSPSDMTIMDSQERRIVARVEFPLGMGWPTQREIVSKTVQHWGVVRLVVDATGMGGDLFTQELIEAGLPVEPFIITQTSREALLVELAVSFERRTILFPKDTTLLRQLRAFQFRKTTLGTWRAEAAAGEHDDAIFSLGLALTACAIPPSVNVMLGRRYSASRYVPTQEEALVGRIQNPRVAAFIKQRREARWAEHHPQGGVGP